MVLEKKKDTGSESWNDGFNGDGEWEINRTEGKTYSHASLNGPTYAHHRRVVGDDFLKDVVWSRDDSYDIF